MRSLATVAALGVAVTCFATGAMSQDNSKFMAAAASKGPDAAVVQSTTRQVDGKADLSNKDGSGKIPSEFKLPERLRGASKVGLPHEVVTVSASSESNVGKILNTPVSRSDAQTMTPTAK
jgi:hypothetical protein